MNPNHHHSVIQPASGAPAPFFREILELALFVIIYWLSVRIGLFVVSQPEGIASVWPASGIALAILLMKPKRRWAILLAAIFITNAAGNWGGGNSLRVSLGYALANTMEAFLCAWIVTYFCKSTITFEKARQVIVLFFAATVMNAITALLGAAVSMLAFQSVFIKSWLIWWAADGLGIGLFTPLIVAWAAKTRKKVSPGPAFNRIMEAVLLVSSLIFITWLCFGPFTIAEDPFLRPYLIFLWMIWLAFRYTPAAMTKALLLFSTIAVWNTYVGYGIFGLVNQTRFEHLIHLQLFLSVTIFSALLLSALVAERQQDKERIELKEKLNLSLLNAITESSFMMTLDGIVLSANNIVAQRLGFPSGNEMTGRNIFDLLPKEVADYRRGCVSEVLKIRKPLYFEDHRSGMDYSNSICPVLDADGNAVSLAVFGIDITERKRSERILQIRQRLLEMAISNTLEELLTATLDEAEAITGSTAGFYVFMEADQITLTLQAWSTHTLQHMCKINRVGMHYPLSQAGVWADCIYTRRPVIHNDYLSLKHRKGLPEGHAPIIRELVVPVIRGDKIMAILGMGNKTDDYNEQDVTALQSLADFAWEIAEIKRAEQLKHQSEEKYRILFENMVHGAFYQSSDGTLFDINPSGLKIFGITREQFIGRTSYDPDWKVIDENHNVLLPENHPSMMGLKTGQLLEGIIGVFNPEKQDYRWVSYSVRPQFKEGEDKPFQVLTTLHDITALKTAEAKLRQIEKSESLRLMAGAIAHHYNNVLAVVMVNLELAMEDPPGDADLPKKLATAMHAARRASEMGGMMLAYLGQKVARRELLDLSDVCRKSITGLMPEMPENVKLEAALPSPGPIIMWNEDQIKQVLTILTTNAREAVGNSPGSIAVNVHNALPSDIPEFHCFPVEFQPKETGYACLEVRDSGCGIAESNFEKLFDPFYSTKFTGRGLGLPLILGAVKIIDGCITVKSELGRWSVFRIYIPIADASPPPANRQSP